MTLSSRGARALLSMVAIGALIAGVLFAYGQLRTEPDQPGLQARGPKPTDKAPTTSAPTPTPDTDADAAGGESEDELNDEAEEQAESTEKRHEAFEKAKAAGTTGQLRPAAAAAPATGWAGEFPMDTQWDDWEPAIAADPSAPWVYALSTRYAAPKPCPGNCPTPWIALEISSDGGATWSDPKALCPCKGSGQFDPIIEVVPGNGNVYAVYMNGFNIMFTKSTNHGTTWSAAVPVYGNVSWNDKPVVAMSDNGQHVYISFNGPTGGDPYVAQSHDSGATWTQTKLVDSNRYYFAFDADVAANGTVYFAESSLLYGGGGNKGTTPTSTIDYHAFVSTNNGSSWTDRLVAQVQPGVACDAAGCPPDFYLGHPALSVDASNNVVYLYDGATTAGGLQTVAAKRSTNGGATWSSAVTLSVGGEEATAPAVESRGNGDVRAFYYQTSGGGNDDAWNVWYRSSTDGGATWSAAVNISDLGSGAAYKTPAGFQEVYGDYGEMAITSAGKTIGAWGEGASYDGPGAVWLNRQP
ncbi:MAG: sialidase family protein [Chloroflexota bacterium]